jgi:hypothetical protein
MTLLPTTKTPPKMSIADLTAVVYGPAKIGKSTFCSNADKALFLATEPGLNNLDTYQVDVRTWEDLLGACAELAAGNHPFKTVVIDTIDNAYKMCEEYICKKHGVDYHGDLAYGKGFSLVNNEFQRVLTKLAFMPYGLYLVSHSQEIEVDSRTGKYHRIVPTIPEKARRILLGLADVILFCDIETVMGADGKPTTKRVMRTKPSLAYESGDRTGRLPETIDLDYNAFLRAFDGNVKPATETVATAEVATKAALK